MEKTTTPTAPVSDEGAITAQPTSPEPVEAATPEPPVSTDEPAGEPSVPATDNTQDPTPEWLQSKGIDPTDPEAVSKLAKMAFNQEKLMTKKTQTASELAKQLNTQPVAVNSDNELVSSLAQEVAALKTSQSVAAFREEVQLTPAQEQSMAEYVTTNPDKGQLYQAGYLTLHDLYAMSGAKNVDVDAIKSQARQETLQDLADKQLAASPSANASSAVPPTNNGDDLAALEARLEGYKF